MKKVIFEGQEARAKLIKGALTVCRILSSTLGPAGRNVIIQRAYSAPEITNDGGTIARHIVLNDPTEDLGAQTIVEATMKTNDRAGDGRSTTALLAGEILIKASKIINENDKSGILDGGANVDAIRLSREILDGGAKVIENLKARPLKKNELRNVVATSIGKMYPEYIDDIADMVEKVGIDGYISVEDNWGTKYGIENTLIQGMRFLGSYSSPVMITDMSKKESVWEDTFILVTNHRIQSTVDIGELVKLLRENKISKLIVISEGYEKDFNFQVTSSYMTNARELAKGNAMNFFKFLSIKAPSLTTDQFKDVAAYVGATFIDKNLVNRSLSNITLADLGFAKKIVVDEDNTIITGGRGNVKERLSLLNKELETEKDSAFKEQLKRRIGAMASGFGIIRVGASTETERLYIKKKIADSVNAAKAALEEGVVQGGGITLKEIADKLGKDNILYEALKAPYERISASLGNKTKVPVTVLDAYKVTRLSVENACSVVAHLITCDASIADVREGLWDELGNKLHPHDNEDFRDDENQELKYRT